MKPSIAILTIAFALAIGCGTEVNEPIAVAEEAQAKNDEVVVQVSDLGLPARDAELIRVVLSEFDDVDSDRSYFLTTTPRSEWHLKKPWNSLSAKFHATLSELSTTYLLASKAYYEDGYVRVRETDEGAWMKWVHIEWESDTKAKVDVGVWTAPLGGGGSQLTYEKIDGEWKITKYGPAWVS